MPRRSPGATLSQAVLPLTALNIGLWDDDVAADRTRGDAVMARIFGLSEAEAAEGLTWERLSAIFHPDDLAADSQDRRRVRDIGGSFAWEHRILPEPGVVRWVLARGYFERDSEGRMRGRGIVIDVTDTRADGHIEGPARFLAASESAGSPVERMAGHALELWQLMDALEPACAARLEPLLKPLMLELGRQIAAALPDGHRPAMSGRPRDPRLH